MKSQYIEDLENKGLATNDHGVRVSTVEQAGGLSGQSVGKIWLRLPDSITWHWIGCGSVLQAAIEARTLKALTPAQIKDKYEL